MEKIRPMKKRDLKYCAMILEQAYSKEPYSETFQPGSALKYIESRFRIGKDHSFVLEESGKIKGFVMSSISYWTTGPQAIVEEIAVSEDSLRRGYATRLNNYLEEHFKSLGVRVAMLWTKKNSPAYKFHRNNNYTEARDVAVMFKLFDKKL